MCDCLCMRIYILVKLKSMTAELKGNDYIFDGFGVCVRNSIETLLFLSLSHYFTVRRGSKSDIDFCL